MEMEKEAAEKGRKESFLSLSRTDTSPFAVHAQQRNWRYVLNTREVYTQRKIHTERR